MLIIELHNGGKQVIDLNNVLNNLAFLEVHAHWAPIADTTYNLHKKSPENIELFDLSPHEATREYMGEAFNAFLPVSAVAVGNVWELNMDSVIPFLSQFHPGCYREVTPRTERGFRLFTRTFAGLRRHHVPNSCRVYFGDPPQTRMETGHP